MLHCNSVVTSIVEAHLLLQSLIFTVKANLLWLFCHSCIVQPPLGWVLASALGHISMGDALQEQMSFRGLVEYSF